MSKQTEEEYLIERLSKLLAEISVIVNGPQPMGVLWSYADLPEKVRALKDAAALPPAVIDKANNALRQYDSQMVRLDTCAYDLAKALRRVLAAAGVKP